MRCLRLTAVSLRHNILCCTRHRKVTSATRAEIGSTDGFSDRTISKRVQQRVTMHGNLSRAGMSALTFSFDGFVFSALARGRKIRGFKALDRAVDWAVMRSPMAAQPYACTLYEDIDIDWINWIKNSRNLHTRAIIRKGSTGSSRIQYAKIYKQSSSACASREPFHQQGVRGPLECVRWPNK